MLFKGVLFKGMWFKEIVYLSLKDMKWISRLYRWKWGNNGDRGIVVILERLKKKELVRIPTLC